MRARLQTWIFASSLFSDSLLGAFGHRWHQQRRVEALFKPVDPPVEMWAGHPTAGADGGYRLSLSD